MSTESSKKPSRFRSLASALSRALDMAQPSETAVLIATALVIGAGTGIGAILFVDLISGFQRFFNGPVLGALAFLGPIAPAFVPLAGALIAGPLITYFASEAKGHGVPEVMKAIALRGGRIRPVVVVVKAIASAACIGSGGSAGREGPIVQIGSALGSTIGQLFKLSDERIRNLVACGAAGGIAATFNAPIAGVIFALEVILGEFNTRYFATVVISSVTASIVSRSILGDIPAFAVPAYSIVSPWELLLYAALGLAAAGVAWLFVTALYWAEDRFEGLRFPEALKPALGAIPLGFVGLALPQALGTGFTHIEEAVSGGLFTQILFVLAFGKILATSLTLGSGNSGGVFAPALFMGAMFGGAFGKVANALFPAITAGSGAYALVGMSAVFAAAAHAPITAVLIVFEMSHDYRLILPLMLATVLSTLFSEHLRRDSIYTLKLTRQGIHLERGHDIDVMQGIDVGEAMTSEFDSVPASMTLPDLAHAFTESHHHGFPVLDERGGLCGVVTLQDMERAAARGNAPALTVMDIASTRLLVAYPDEPLWVALKRMGGRDVGRLPVVSRDNPTRLLGIIRRADIIKAYNKAIIRRMELQHHTERLRLGKLTGTEFAELVVGEDAAVSQKPLRELILPHECVLVSVRRGRKLIIPHGDTVLQPGDRVTALVAEECLEDFRIRLSARESAEE
jgi:CIC family chloride channel protein